MTQRVDAVVVGAGVIGLACARRLALSGLEVVVLERERQFGQGISSRSSEVIHAGIYYSPGSLKARLCVEGSRLLFAYCEERGIPHRRIGKWIVAANEAEACRLESMYRNALANGVSDVHIIDGPSARQVEPELRCHAALISENTGIVDSHALMLSLLGDLEAAKGVVAYRSAATCVEHRKDAFYIDVAGDEGSSLAATCLINAGGLDAPLLVERPAIQRRFAKGSYFSYNGRVPFRHLIYPVPEPGGLGTHLTFDLGGHARFGPDVEWVESPDYRVQTDKAAAFARSIRRYWPACEQALLSPAYAGIRPKIQAEGVLVDDFLIFDASHHGYPNRLDLCGIESPGLTASMAIAEEASLRLGLMN